MSRTQKRRKTYVSSDGTVYVPVTVKVPVSLFKDMNSAISRQGNTDRSKFCREAFEDRIRKLGATA